MLILIQHLINMQVNYHHKIDGGGGEGKWFAKDHLSIANLGQFKSRTQLIWCKEQHQPLTTLLSFGSHTSL